MSTDYIDDILEDSKPATDHVDVCFRLDLVTEHQRLLGEQLKLTRSRDTDRLGVPTLDQVTEIDEQIKAVREQMDKATLRFHMIGIPTEEYNVLQRQAGKPRDGNRNDMAMGFNLLEFYKRLVKKCTYSITRPGEEPSEGTRPTAERWTAIFSKINDGQFDLIGDCARRVNREVVTSPTAPRT